MFLATRFNRRLCHLPKFSKLLVPRNSKFYSSEPISEINESATKIDSDQNTTELENDQHSSKAETKESVKYKELHYSYLSVLADMENLRVRTRREIEIASNHSITKFAKDLLPVLDVLEIALKDSENASNTASVELMKSFSDFRVGVDMTRKELMSVFKRNGIEPIEVQVGDNFDPNLHTAIFQVPKAEESQPNRVVAIQKTGYKIKDRILRHTQVGVSS